MDIQRRGQRFRIQAFLPVDTERYLVIVLHAFSAMFHVFMLIMQICFAVSGTFIVTTKPFD
jgi:hypothetical protein